MTNKKHANNIVSQATQALPLNWLNYTLKWTAYTTQGSFILNRNMKTGWELKSAFFAYTTVGKEEELTLWLPNPIPIHICYAKLDIKTREKIKVCKYIKSSIFTMVQGTKFGLKIYSIQLGLYKHLQPLLIFKSNSNKKIELPSISNGQTQIKARIHVKAFINGIVVNLGGRNSLVNFE